MDTDYPVSRLLKILERKNELLNSRSVDLALKLCMKKFLSNKCSNYLHSFNI